MTMDHRLSPPPPVESVCRGRSELDGCTVGHAFALATGLLAILLSTSAWSANQKSNTVVLWQGDDQWVRIEPQDDSATPNDHPARLGAEEVGDALAALRLRVTDKDSGTETQRSVFTQKEIATLAPQLVAGLGKADPRQDVTFSTIGSYALSAGGLVKDLGVNAGRVFYQGGKLNVIFGELQSNYRKKNIYGQRTEDFSQRRQGSRDKASKQKWPMAAVPGVELHAARNDWVVIDPAVAAAASMATAAPSTAAPQQTAPVATPSASPTPPASAPAADSTSTAGGPTAAGASAPTAPASATAASAAPATKSGKASDLEQRLQTLKDLRDKGLISEEVYNSKVKELLSEL
jgi:hypothetical protein